MKKIYDIVLYNVQGSMSVGIITRIIITGYEGVEQIQYFTDKDHYIDDSQITKVVGNAEEIKNEVEGSEHDS